jgi:hypothetical protein
MKSHWVDDLCLQESLLRNKFCLSLLENISKIVSGELKVYCTLLEFQQFLAEKQ